MQRWIRTRGHMGQNPLTACFTDLRGILESYTASAPVVFTSFLVVVFFIIFGFWRLPSRSELLRIKYVANQIRDVSGGDPTPRHNHREGQGRVPVKSLPPEWQQQRDQHSICHNLPLNLESMGPKQYNTGNICLMMCKSIHW